MRACVLDRPTITPEAATRTFHTELADPWGGETMRLPIAVMANIELGRDPKGMLARGIARFVGEAGQRRRGGHEGG